MAEQGIAGLTAADRDHLTLGWHRLHAWPDVADGHAPAASRASSLGPLSNGNVSLLVDLARFNRLPWDVILGAEVVRHYKPDAEAYLGACALLSLPPDEVMLCAAHNDDLAHAQALGMRTAFVARPAEYGPHQVRDFAATGAWDHAVAGIDGLAAALGA